MSYEKYEESSASLENGDPYKGNQKYPRALFHGRIGRWSYLVRILLAAGAFVFSLSVPITIWVVTSGVINLEDPSEFDVSTSELAGLGLLWLIIFLVVSLPVTIYTYNAMIRRLHDMNQSAWLITIDIGLWFLTLVLPVVGPFLYIPLLGFRLYVLFAPGTKGVNKYGPPTTRLL